MKKRIYSAEVDVNLAPKNLMDKVYQKIEELKVMYYLKGLGKKQEKF